MTIEAVLMLQLSSHFHHDYHINSKREKIPQQAGSVVTRYLGNYIRTTV